MKVTADTCISECVWGRSSPQGGKYLTWSASASFLHGDALIWLIFHWLELICIRSRVFQTLREKKHHSLWSQTPSLIYKHAYTIISLTTVHRFNFTGFSPSSASPFEPSLFLFLDSRAEPWASIQALWNVMEKTTGIKIIIKRHLVVHNLGSSLWNKKKTEVNNSITPDVGKSIS